MEGRSAVPQSAVEALGHSSASGQIDGLDDAYGGSSSVAKYVAIGEPEGTGSCQYGYAREANGVVADPFR